MQVGNLYVEYMNEVNLNEFLENTIKLNGPEQHIYEDVVFEYMNIGWSFINMHIFRRWDKETLTKYFYNHLIHFKFSIIRISNAILASHQKNK